MLLIQPYSPKGKVETGFRVCLRAGVNTLYRPKQVYQNTLFHKSEMKDPVVFTGIDHL